MSMNFYNNLEKDRKIITVKFPDDKEHGANWEYVITHKDDVKQVQDKLKAGDMKDMKTILYNTKKLIEEARNANK